MQQIPLHHTKNEAVAKLLLDHGAHVNARTDSEDTPLHYAHNEAIAKLLLDHGADVHSEQTPLHYASNVAEARVLINRGAQLTAVDKNGRNALHFAALWGKIDLLQRCWRWPWNKHLWTRASSCLTSRVELRPRTSRTSIKPCLGARTSFFFLRHIAGFIPRTRYEEGEGEGEDER